MGSVFLFSLGGDEYEGVYNASICDAYDLYLRKIGCEEWIKIPKPEDASLQIINNNLIFNLNSNWRVNDTTYLAGSLLTVDFQAYLNGESKFTVLFEPELRSSIVSFGSTKNYLYIHYLENLRNQFFVLEYKDGKWVREILNVPLFGSMEIYAEDEATDRYCLVHNDYITPSTFWKGDFSDLSQYKVKSLSIDFCAEHLKIFQYEAISKDGTRIPYFMVGPKDMNLDGSHPTILDGYCGFGLSNLPPYQSFLGSSWLENGGVYVEANIRGGGEFGPNWHNSAKKEKR